MTVRFHCVGPAADPLGSARGKQVLAHFEAIASQNPDPNQWNELQGQEVVEVKRFLFFGEKVPRIERVALTPRQAAWHYMNQMTVYVQRMHMPFPISMSGQFGLPMPGPKGNLVLVLNDRTLEQLAGGASVHR